MSNKETTLNKRYEKHLNLELRNLASQNDYYIKEQEPGLIDLYSKDGFEIGELIELGFKSIEDVARYIDILSGYKNPKLFPEQPIGRTNREKFIGTCIMLDASAQECLKDLLESNYKIWPDSFHSFIIAEDRDIVDKLIKKYHLTEMRRGVDIFDTHNVYNGDIVDYVSQSTIDGDEYSGANINRTLKDIMRDARKTSYDEYDYLSQKYDFDESLEKSIYEEMNEIDDLESLSEDYLIEVTKSDKDMFDIDLFGDKVDHNYTEPISLYQAALSYFGDRRNHVSNISGSKSGKPNEDSHHDFGRENSDKQTSVAHEDHPRIHSCAIKEVITRILNSPEFKSSGWTAQELANFLQWRAYQKSVNDYIKRRSDAYQRVLLAGSKKIQNILDDLKKEYPDILATCTDKFMDAKANEPEQLKIKDIV